MNPHERILDGSASRVRQRALDHRYHLDTPFRQLGRQVGRAAVAGFGFALGRDLYRLAKGLLGVALYVAIPLLWLILPMVAGKLLTRRSGMWDYMNGVLSLVGGALACGLVAGFLTLNSPQLEAVRSFAVVWFLLLLPGLALGIWIGIGDRIVLEEAALVAERNQAFLEQHGIRETGGKHITHFDDYETPLRFLEAHHDRLVFMVVGARGKRAHIMLNEDGLMTSYSGVVSLRPAN